MKCSKVERHEQHWHTVMAGTIVVAGGMCDGTGRPAPDAVPSGEATDGTTPTKEA